MATTLERTIITHKPPIVDALAAADLQWSDIASPRLKMEYLMIKAAADIRAERSRALDEAIARAATSYGDSRRADDIAALHEEWPA